MSMRLCALRNVTNVKTVYDFQPEANGRKGIDSSLFSLFKDLRPSFGAVDRRSVRIQLVDEAKDCVMRAYQVF